MNFNACTEDKEQEQVNYPVTNDFLVDSRATVETVALYEFHNRTPLCTVPRSFQRSKFHWFLWWSNNLFL